MGNRKAPYLHDADMEQRHFNQDSKLYVRRFKTARKAGRQSQIPHKKKQRHFLQLHPGTCER